MISYTSLKKGKYSSGFHNIHLQMPPQHVMIKGKG